MQVLIKYRWIINDQDYRRKCAVLEVHPRKDILIEKASLAGWWWRMPLIPAFGRQRQADLNEFEASLVNKR